MKEKIEGNRIGRFAWYLGQFILSSFFLFILTGLSESILVGFLISYVSFKTDEIKNYYENHEHRPEE